MSIVDITFEQGAMAMDIPAGAGGESITDITFDAVRFTGIRDLPTVVYPVIGGSHVFALGGDVDG